MKHIRTFLPLILLLGSVPLLQAQGSFDVAVGFGSVHDKATGLGIDNVTFGSCTPSSTATTCEATPGLGGLLMGFEGDGMLNKHIGIGGELSFQPTKSNYGPLQYRQMFYTFNGIYAPINKKRLQLRLEGGIGGAHSGFSYTETSCVGTAVCTTQAASVGSAGHFQVHVGAGVQFYVKPHIFIRPQFDFREVPGFTNQFGSDQVIGGTIWVGYNFGEM
ncbi:MAG: outer membrane beta-barrel protein [Terriglobia bacterium]